MSRPIIEVQGISKRYRLGQIGFSSFRDEAERLLGRLRGRDAAAQAADEAKRAASDFWALRDVSFSVQPGEVVGVVGRNGAGKSTLLKLLSRITEPSSGEITLRGRAGSLLEVGTGFHPELSGRDNIFLNGAILGMKRAEIARKFDEIVAFAEVGQFIDTPVKRYSSGMYVRLAFAVAAHLEPEILIVDEVLAVGDAAFQAKCVAKLESIRRDSGATVLLVSHNADLIARLCSRAVFLESGRLRASGDTTEIMHLYHGRNADEQTRSGQWVELSATPRRGDGRARFTRARYLSPSGGEGARPGERLRFELEVEAGAACHARSLAVTLYGEARVKLLNYDTILKGAPLALHPGLNRFEIETGPLPLNPGAYPLGLWLEIDAARGPSDHLETAFRLDVVPPPSPQGAWQAPYTDGAVVAEFALANPSGSAA